MTRAFEVLHLPFIFESREQAHRALDSEKVKARINDELAEVGFRWLLTFEYGFRNIDTTEISAIEAFGASSVTIDWPEVYNALRFGVVDGEAQPFATMVSARHHELIRHHLDINFQYFAFVGMISLDEWNGYPDWAKEVIAESAREAELYHRKIWEEEDAKARAALIEQGAEIVVPDEDQLAKWVEAGRTTWASSGVPEEMIELVQSEATDQ